MPRISSWLCAALLLCGTALASDQNRFQLEYAKDFPFHGGRVSIDHSFGGVKVETDSGSMVHVRATIRASDPEFGREIRVLAEEHGGGVSIKTEYPRSLMRGRHSSFSVDYRITVPESAPVDVKNKYGSISVSGTGGPGTVINSFGSIRVRDTRGPQRVENSFGSVELRNSGGVTNVTNKYGSVRAREVGGDLTVSNGFGSVDVDGVRGDMTIHSQNGGVVARHIGGSAKISNAFGSIVAGDIKRNADISNQNARVELTDVGGSANVNTSYGSVQLEDIAGDANVRTSFASVFGRRLHGAIDVKNQNGAIGVAEVGSDCRPISLVTSFSSIRVSLPESAKYTVNARTSFGRISSAIPITTRTASEDTLIGSIGGGGCRMELVNSNGAITIEKE